MKIYITIFAIFNIFCNFNLYSNDELNDSPYINSIDILLRNKPGLQIGGYGEVHFNQPLNSKKQSSTFDAHRLVMFLGYNFSRNTQIISEIEFEHANEIWIEQLFLQQRLHKYINLRAGLMLIPMGIINEYHEPTTFNGIAQGLTVDLIADYFIKNNINDFLIEIGGEIRCLGLDSNH